MRTNQITKRVKNVKGKPRDIHHWQSRGVRVGHPRRQQSPATVRTIHYEMDHAPMDNATKDRDPPSRKRMMQIFNDNVEQVFLGSMSLARPASAKAGWRRRSATRPAATIDRCFIIARPSSSKTSLSIRFQQRPHFRVQFRPLLGEEICLSA